jgi:hypothetical protein
MKLFFFRFCTLFCERQVLQVFVNRSFSKINSDISPNKQHGYGSWYKGHTDTSSTMSLEDHSKVFSTYKDKHIYNPTENIVSIIVPEMVQGNIGYSMLVDEPVEYSSGMFTPLQYTDLKRSYTHSLIDISSDTFDIGTKPQSIEQMNQIRKSTVPPISIGESKSMFDARDNAERDISTHRAYILCKQLEQAQMKNHQMTCDFFKIIN